MATPNYSYEKRQKEIAKKKKKEEKLRQKAAQKTGDSSTSDVTADENQATADDAPTAE